MSAPITTGSARCARRGAGCWRSLVALLALLAATSALAQETEPGALRTFLAPLQQHPTVRAARAQVRAAGLALDAAFDPVSLSADGAFNAFDAAAVDVDPGTPGVQRPPASATSIGAALTFRPFVFGDVADQADQRRVELRQAELEADAGLAQVEVQALDAAYAVALAQRALVSAREGAALADLALAATRTRFDNGAANVREVREAETGAAEAHSFVADAEGGLALARTSLTTLVGDAPPPDLEALAFPLPAGVPASVQRARLAAALVEVGIRNARRSVYPAAQASYAWNLDDHSTVGVALESRTLQPTVNFAYADPGASFPQDAVNGTFTLGVSAKISPGVFQGLAATEARLHAAQDGVAAAEQGAALQRAALDEDLARALRALAIAERKRQDAGATLQEARRREALGLDIPLTTQSASLELTRQALAVRQARQDVFDATLAFYPFYALPLSRADVAAERPAPSATPEARP